MHEKETLAYLVETPATKVFLILLILSPYDTGELLFHILQDNVELLSPVIQGDTLDHLIAIEKSYQTCLVDYHLSFFFCRSKSIFQHKDLLITLSLNFLDLALVKSHVHKKAAYLM